jgi:hypothetical protein
VLLVGNAEGGPLMIYEYGGMLSGSTKGSLRRGKNIGENTDGPAEMNKIDDGYYANKIEWHAAGAVVPTSHSNSMRGEDILEEPNIGLVGQGIRRSSLSNLIGAAAIVGTMNELAQAKREQRTVPSKRKSALPVKKAKRKMVQASRKRNR